MAMSMASHYPDKPDLVMAMADLAIEELAHFKQVLRHINARGLTLIADTKDPYIQEAIRKHIRNGKDEYFMDRLLSAGIIEARGHEKFSIVAEDRTWLVKTMYAIIAKAEAKHHQLGIR